MKEELNEYREAIEFLAEQKDSFTFDNKGADHAAIVLLNMLKNTEEEFVIFSGNLNGEVADNDDVLNELKNYLLSGKNFKLVLEDNQIKSKSKALNLVESLEQENENIKIAFAKKYFLDEIKNIFDGEVLHFLVSDAKSYRLEIDKKAYKAVCSFNQPEIAKKLSSLINSNF